MTPKLDQFTLGYLDCALWSSIGDDDTPLDRNYSISDIAPSELTRIIADCAEFQSTHEALLMQAGDALQNGAQNQREYEAKENAKNRLEEIESEIKENYAAFRRFTRELRKDCDRIKGITVVSELIREHWHGVKDEIRKLRREQKRIEDHGIEY